jgi:hypothetical protein
MMWRGLIILVLASWVTPALAQTGVQIPEPSDFALFALGVAGLIVGRQSSRRSPKDRDDDA